MLENYCCGCGLCKSLCDTPFVEKNGFYVPIIDSKNVNLLVNICPVLTTNRRVEVEPIYGNCEISYLGYSKNNIIRHKGSSGGTLTALAVYMLERKMINGVVHIAENKSKPWETTVVCSTTKEQLIERAGSRYAQSFTLENILDYLDNEEKYLLIGKPCDIRAMRNYAELEPKVNIRFPYMFSFFCMGTPSTNANIRLIKQMEVPLEECQSVRYRGDGWPGYTVVETKNGEKHSMTYNDSWGGILGRDLRKYCKFCMDGFGDAADIACGDAWYLDDDKNPIFNEGSGRNVIIARTSKGRELISDAIDNNVISCISYDCSDDLRYMQKSQYARKELMLYRQMALQVLLQKGPRYKVSYLKQYTSNVSAKRRIDAFVGTMARIIKRKL
jgi:coenzyme F420 hydrogenase subunit beta